MKLSLTKCCLQGMPLWFVAFKLLTGVIAATPNSESARQVWVKHRDGVVIVEGVLKVELLVNGTQMMEPRESRTRATGFLVDPSGVVVVSSFHLNPMSLLADKPIRTEQNGQSMEMEMRSRLEKLRLRWRDQELAVRIRVQDKDSGLTLLEVEPGQGGSPARFPAIPLDDIAVPVVSTQYLVVDRGTATFRNEAILESGTISAVLTRPRTRYMQDTGRHWMFTGAPFFDLEGRLLGLGMLEVRPPSDPAAGTWDSAPIPIITPAAEIRELLQRTVEGKEGDGNRADLKPAAKKRLPEMESTESGKILAGASGAVVAVEGSVKFKCGRCAEDHEEELADVGTVLDPSGLIVVAGKNLSAQNRYVEQRLRCTFGDGRELPVHILLHDDELSLTVLGPATPKADGESTFEALRLNRETRSELLDDVVVVGRLGSEARYALSAAVGHVVGRTEQPRLFYQVYSVPPALSYYGLPVMTVGGECLGITVPDPQESSQEIDPELNPFAAHGSPPRIVPASALLDALESVRKHRQEEVDP